MTKEDEILTFLSERLFEPILNSPNASRQLKSAVKLIMARLKKRSAKGMIRYFWSAVVGYEKDSSFARMLKEEGFSGLEELTEEFSKRFNDD